MGRPKGSKNSPHAGMVEIICKICGKIFKVGFTRKKTAKYCSKTCRHISDKGHIPWNKNKKVPQISGKNHWNYKTGTFIKNNYVYVCQPHHPNATKNGYVKRSYLVIEKMIARYLTPEEIVHHKGVHFSLSSAENKQDDSPENLQLFSNIGKHTTFHLLLRHSH